MFVVRNGGDSHWLRIFLANGRSMRYRLDESTDGEIANASIDSCQSSTSNKGYQ